MTAAANLMRISSKCDTFCELYNHSTNNDIVNRANTTYICYYVLRALKCAKSGQEILSIAPSKSTKRYNIWVPHRLSYELNWSIHWVWKRCMCNCTYMYSYFDVCLILCDVMWMSLCVHKAVLQHARDWFGIICVMVHYTNKAISYSRSR